MTANVSFLLQALDASPTADPVDWLMGDPWAELDLGRTSRLSLLKRAERDLKELDGRGGVPGRGGGAARPRVSTIMLARKPEAMVKLVRSGGTTDARGMGGQAGYLQKAGAVELEASERHFGATLSGSLLEETLADWSKTASKDAKADRTTHFVVSFPIGTDETAAYRAGRAWAEAMFDEGTYGDVWDYYTAFHTDTAHPHMHVVVSRRGVEHGTWLKISRRGAIDYDELRFVQVEVAQREGIFLQATPRFARAIHERPVADERQRIAARSADTAERSAPNGYATARTALQALVHARSVQADADIVRDADRSLAGALDAVAADLRAGRSGQDRPASIPVNEATKRAEEIVMSKRDELERNLDRVDAELATIPDPSARAPLEREASRLKARAADVLPSRTELRDWRADGETDAYRGLAGSEGRYEGDRERDIRGRARIESEMIASNAGFDGAAVADRYAGEGASPALAERWRRDEIEMFKRSRPIGFASNPERVEEAANEAYTSVHRRIASQFTAARNELAELQQKRDGLRREAQRREHQRSAARDAGAGEDDANFARSVRDVLSSREIESLERGDAGGLASVTPNAMEQAVLARRFVEQERRTAEGERREHLQRAAVLLEQSEELALKQTAARTLDEKGRGLDL